MQTQRALLLECTAYRFMKYEPDSSCYAMNPQQKYGSITSNLPDNFLGLITKVNTNRLKEKEYLQIYNSIQVEFCANLLAALVWFMLTLSQLNKSGKNSRVHWRK